MTGHEMMQGIAQVRERRWKVAVAPCTLLII
jgi:hypothetical protein